MKIHGNLLKGVRSERNNLSRVDKSVHPPNDQLNAKYRSDVENRMNSKALDNGNRAPQIPFATDAKHRNGVENQCTVHRSSAIEIIQFRRAL